jgi:predicted ATPase/DNA-binding NarL/FixJ family response regulator
MADASTDLISSPTTSNSQKSRALSGAYPPHLPQYLTPFVGRKAEIDELRRLLETPECRLLTLVGPGGIGKTRLATALLQHMQRLGRPVAFVDLQAVENDAMLLPVLIDALGLPRGDRIAPLNQLADYLRGKEMAIVFDNFEHLLEGAGVLSNLLLAAPGLKILATSRVALQLQEEWLYPVSGLHYPDDASKRAGSEVSEAAQLFYACARRVRPDFTPEAEAAGVAQVCRLVEGMPLAIELAAAWTVTMSAAEIAAEIRENLDFLVSPLRNRHARHRSIQAVFQRSWQMLTPDEQNVFMRLSVFRGGFTREAAIMVGDASLPLLAALVSHSLLRWRPNGRYEIHALLRQYGEAALSEFPQAMHEAHDRHSRYFSVFLGDQLQALITQPRATASRIYADLDNIRTAWQWDVAQANLEGIERAGFALFGFCQRQSRYLEGVEMLAAGCEVLRGLPPSAHRARVLAELLTAQSWLALRLGRLEQAAAVLEEAETHYAEWRLVPAPLMGTDPQAARPLLAVIQGDYERARVWAKRAWETTGARNDPANQVLAGYCLISALIAQGQYEAALDQAQATLALSKALGDRWFTAYVYNHLGAVNQVLGDLQAATNYYQASYELRQELGDPEGMAVALHHLGEIARQQDNYDAARRLFTESLSLYGEIGDQGGLARAHHGLGMAYVGLDDDDASCTHLGHALQITADAGLVPQMLAVMADIGGWLAARNQRAWARATLAFVAAHEAGDRLTQDKAQEALRELAGEEEVLSAPDMASADVAELVQTLQQQMARARLTETDSSMVAMPPGARPLSSATSRSPVLQAPPLLEPLSARELEVLNLMAAGHTNQQIADALFITVNTVKAHGNHIYGKLAVANRVQAIARARELALL